MYRNTGNLIKAMNVIIRRHMNGLSIRHSTSSLIPSTISTISNRESVNDHLSIIQNYYSEESKVEPYLYITTHT